LNIESEEHTMSRQLISPAELDCITPGRRDYHVTFEHPTLWGHFLVPVTVMVGPDAAPGRGLVAIGSTHGNEYEGPVAIKHLLQEIDVADVSGRLILIPVLNAAAFAAGTRDTPEDGANLNRAFPGDGGGGITARFADFITRQIFPHVHVVIDLHAGGRVARFPMVASFHHVADSVQRCEMELAARDFGVPIVMIYQDNTPGLLTSSAEKLGKITIGSELGWGQAVNRTGVAMARQGILRAAVRQGLLRGALPANRHCAASEQRLVDTSDPACSLLAPFAGHFEPTVARGEHVAAGKRVGYLHDFDRIDAAAHTLNAPHDGYVVCQGWEARVLQGQVVTQVGKALPWQAPAPNDL
jgi:predicted deacylase